MAHDKEAMGKALFLNMVMMFSSSAMQQMGKIVNPATGKTAVDLQGAQFFIDLLEMLREKTTNNLDKDEARLLNDTLATLQLNYVETSEQQGKEEPDPTKAAAPTGKEPEAEPTPADKAAEKTKPDEKDPRYHKSYG